MPEETAYLPEVAEYFRLIHEAEQATAEARRAMYGRLPALAYGDSTRDEVNARWEERAKAGAEIDERFENGLTKAREALVAEGSDPVVRWIAEHALRDYEGEAHQALRVFQPGGDRLAELDQASRHWSWCNVYAGMRRRMLNDGVLSTTGGEHRRILESALRRRGWSEDHITRELDAFIREHNESVAAPIAPPT